MCPRRRIAWVPAPALAVDELGPGPANTGSGNGGKVVNQRAAACGIEQVDATCTRSVLASAMTTGGVGSRCVAVATSAARKGAGPQPAKRCSHDNIGGTGDDGIASADSTAAVAAAQAGTVRRARMVCAVSVVSEDAPDATAASAKAGCRRPLPLGWPGGCNTTQRGKPSGRGS